MEPYLLVTENKVVRDGRRRFAMEKFTAHDAGRSNPPERELSWVCFAQVRSGEQFARYQASFAMDAKGIKLEMTEDRKNYESTILKKRLGI